MKHMIHKNVVITGGMGYIGSHTCVELLEQGANVIIVDNLCNSNAEVLNRMEKITGRRPLFYQIDVRDEQALSNVFAENKVDAVVYGHLHGKNVRADKLVVKNGIKYYLTSCDQVDNKLTEIEL